MINIRHEVCENTFSEHFIFQSVVYRMAFNFLHIFNPIFVSGSSAGNTASVLDTAGA